MPVEPSVTDSRGRVVRSIGKAPTFLSEAHVDEPVALYREGMTLDRLSERFNVYHRDGGRASDSPFDSDAAT